MAWRALSLIAVCCHVKVVSGEDGVYQCEVGYVQPHGFDRCQ